VDSGDIPILINNQRQARSI